MDVVMAICERIAALAGMAALVDDRVYAEFSAQGSELPYVRVQFISEVEPMHLRGAIGLPTCRIQVDARAGATESGADARTVALSVSDAIHGDGAGSGLSGFKGFVGGSPAFEIAAIRPAGKREGYDPQELRQYYVQRDYLVSFKS